MLLTEVVPRTLRTIDAADDAGRVVLADVYAAPAGPSVRVNLVAALGGAVSGPDGTSESITGGADRVVLGCIRRAADVVVVGAATVRAEGFAVPRTAPLAVVTASGDLGPHDIPDRRGAPGPVLVVCPAGRAGRVESAVSRPGVTVVPVPGDGRLDPRAVLAALRARGLDRVVCEGGPDLVAQLGAAGVVDEYCITVSPVFGPDAGPRLALPDIATTPAGLLVDEAGFSYLRLRPR